MAIYSSIIYYCILIEYYVMAVLTPSMIARSIPPTTAFLKAAYAPYLMARTPPVMKPAAI
jgi:hypothetical protein